MTRTWNDLEGVSLGPYWLKVCLTSSADDAWYLIRYDTARDAAVRVRDAAAPGADAQLEFWRRTTALEHPHIVRMYDSGRAQAEGDEYIYCVCQYPDDFLAAALRERPLSPAETRQVLDAVLPALAFLHEQDLVHGAVDSSHIMAFGDTIKLPSDTIRPADAAAGVAPASDMRSLGLLLHEMLTRDVPREDAETDFSYIPEPFRSIVRNTVKPGDAGAWTVADIRNHLNPPPKPPPAAEPARVVVSEPSPRAEAAPAPADDAQRPLPPLPPLPPRLRSEPPVDRGFPLKWIPVAGFAAAAVLGAFVLRRPDPPAAVPDPAPVTAPAPAKKTAPPPALPEERKPSPSGTLPAPAKQSRDRSLNVDARPSTGAPIWRVIAFTYNAKSHAEKKVKAINEKHPGFRAQVFTPKGDRAPYFISLGGRMTLAEAERLQKDARSKGLPKDTFVRNFSN
jgi:hypothetical protein